MRTIDLNAARAARAEKDQDEPIIIVIGEDHYKLPREMPLTYLEAAGELADKSRSEDENEQADVPGLIIRSIVSLVGAETYAELIGKHALTMDDLRVIFQQTGNLYGVSLGEASASPVSSDADTTP